MARKSRKDKNFIKTPQYPGGSEALRKFIDSQLRYPDLALERMIEGQVHLAYTVSDEGHVEDVEVVNGIGHGCDEEAIRVISLLKYAPAGNHGVKVRSSMRTRINFRLPQAPAPVLNYTVTAKPEKQKPAVKPAGGNTYGYTISFGETS
ncbi:MAG: energy transducer TonB [Bacteroidota bacterium]